jgi:hypothetical protein
MTDKTIETLFRECRAAKPLNDGHIIIATQEPVNYDKLIKTMGGELIKLGGVTIKETKKPKFSMGAHLETIKEYEGPECPYECGVVTDIKEDRGNIMYEIDYDVLIYEKWLRVVEK